MYIYSNALYKYVIYEQRPDHNTGNYMPYSLTSPASHYSEDAGDGAYGLSSLSEKTRISNHLQMSLQRQHILLSYFKTLSVGPVWGHEPETSRTVVRRSTNWANRSAEKDYIQVHCMCIKGNCFPNIATSSKNIGRSSTRDCQIYLLYKAPLKTALASWVPWLIKGDLWSNSWNN